MAITYTATPADINVKPGGVTSSNTATGTISWTPPTISGEYAIVSQTLTGYAQTADTSKVSETSVNGVNVTCTTDSSAAFSIDLGTASVISSVTASMTRSSRLNQPSVNFQSMTYTLVYEDGIFTVTYQDNDGTILSTQTIYRGFDATPPDDPYHYGYIFTGWSSDGKNIQASTTITAQFRAAELYTINFYDWDGTLLQSQQVYEREPITPPAEPNTKYGYSFKQWSDSLDMALYSADIYAVYDKVNYNIRTMKLKPTSYQNTDWTTDYPFEYAYDDDTSTAVKGLIKTGDACFIKYFWSPSAIDLQRYIFTDKLPGTGIKLCMQACCKNSTATGQGVLRVGLISNNRDLDHAWLWYYCDWKTYEYDLTYNEYLTTDQGVEFEGYSEHDLGTVAGLVGQGTYAYIFDLYLKINYVDAGEEIILSHIEETLHQEQMLHVEAYFYPLSDNLVWSVYEDSDIVKIYPSADGRTCDIVAEKTGECFVVVQSESNPSITNSIYLFINEAEVERRTAFRIGDKTINSSNLRFGNSFVPKVYLGDNLLVDNIYTVPYEKFVFNSLKEQVYIPLYTQLTAPTGYCVGLVCRNGNYIGLGLLDGGHEPGGIKSSDGDLSVDVGNATDATLTGKEQTPVYPGEKLIITYPTTTYSFGLVGYDANGDYKYTYFGDSIGWQNYDYQDDADIEGPQLNVTIPDDVYYIRWCYHKGNYSEEMDKLCYLRRYTVRDIDLEAWPPNATEGATMSATSSNTGIAKIENGMIRAQAPGQCTVTVTQGSLSATINVYVYDNSELFGSYDA